MKARNPWNIFVIQRSKQGCLLKLFTNAFIKNLYKNAFILASHIQSMFTIQTILRHRVTANAQCQSPVEPSPLTWKFELYSAILPLACFLFQSSQFLFSMSSSAFGYPILHLHSYTLRRTADPISTYLMEEIEIFLRIYFKF